VNLWELSSLGIEFAFIFVGSVLLGNYIDEKADTSPWGLMLFAVTGFSLAIYYIVYRANKINSDDK
jgi:F0F1-type ATP synthase assembly protein I